MPRIIYSIKLKPLKFIDHKEDLLGTKLKQDKRSIVSAQMRRERVIDPAQTRKKNKSFPSTSYKRSYHYLALYDL